MFKRKLGKEKSLHLHRLLTFLGCFFPLQILCQKRVRFEAIFGKITTPKNRVYERHFLLQPSTGEGGGQNWIRTSEGVSQRIYSPYLSLGKNGLLAVYLPFRIPPLYSTGRKLKVRKTKLRLSQTKIKGQIFHVVFYPGMDGKRKKRHFKARSDAREFHDQKRVELANFGTAAAAMDERDRAEYLECRDIFTGVRLKEF